VKAEFAQMAALACHANAFLRGMAVPEFHPGNSTCKFCESVTFAVNADVVAGSPNAWFQSLRESGVSGVRFVHEAANDPRIADHKSAAFVGGGGHTVLAARRDGRWDLWGAGWKFGDRHAKDRRVWSVRYERFGAVDELLPEKTPAEATAALREALRHIHAFATANAIDGFAGSFAQGLALLDGEPALPPFHDDLFVAGTLSEAASRLLKASQPSWVFGGMGSWNDMILDGSAGEEYARVTSALYAALLDAIAAGVNETESG
jgi:hypothetical protein